MSQVVSAAIVGVNPLPSDPFKIAFTGTSSTAKAIKRGGYVISTDQDCYVAIAVGTGVVAVVSPTSQDGSALGGQFLRALNSAPLQVPSDGMYIAVIRDSTSGTLQISGPFDTMALP
jgi:hypothetical protein